MKRIVPILILLFATTLTLSAQKRGTKQRTSKTESTTEKTSSRSKSVKGEKQRSDNPREDRSFAITSESGFKSLSGFGLVGSYYVSPKVAIDLGLGFGLQVVKGGLRGRYLFLDKNFTPYVGAGVFFNPLSIPDVFIDDPNGSSYTIDINSSTFGQFVVGLEYMADIGFTIGFNVGYAASLSGDNWETSESVDSSFAETLNTIYGSSGSIGFNIGWAF